MATNLDLDATADAITWNDFLYLLKMYWIDANTVPKL